MRKIVILFGVLGVVSCAQTSEKAMRESVHSNLTCEELANKKRKFKNFGASDRTEERFLESNFTVYCRRKLLSSICNRNGNPRYLISDKQISN